MINFRHIFAPLVLRFQDTDGLLAAFNFLELVYRDKLNNERIWNKKDRMQRLIAKELLRRKVKFW